MALKSAVIESYSFTARWVALPCWIALGVAYGLGYWQPGQLCEKPVQPVGQHHGAHHVKQDSAYAVFADRASGGPDGAIHALVDDHDALIGPLAETNKEPTQARDRNGTVWELQADGERSQEYQRGQTTDQLVPAVKRECAPEAITDLHATPLCAPTASVATKARDQAVAA